MMQWRGQGVLTSIVLVAAGAYAIQWHTVTKLQDSIEGSGLLITPYTQSISEFVDHAHRWPTANEVSLPMPPAGGIVRKVTLGEHGMLHFALTGWTLRGRITATFAPSIMSASTFEPKGRLRYACVAVKPAFLEGVVCRQWGISSLEKIEAAHAQEFAEWQDDTEHAGKRRTVIATAGSSETECDRIAYRAGQVSECVVGVDAELGGRIAASLSTKFRNRPRLRPEILADDPDLLAKYNRQCTEEWADFVAQMVSENHEMGNCLPENM
jgi:hypothetical protein